MLAAAPYFAAYTLGDPQGHHDALRGAGRADAADDAAVGAAVQAVRQARRDDPGRARCSAAARRRPWPRRCSARCTPTWRSCWSAIGIAGVQLLQFSMLADVIAVDAAATGKRRAGVFTGLWTAIESGVSAFGALVFGDHPVDRRLHRVGPDTPVDAAGQRGDRGPHRTDRGPRADHPAVGADDVEVPADGPTPAPGQRLPRPRERPGHQRRQQRQAHHERGEERPGDGDDEAASSPGGRPTAGVPGHRPRRPRSPTTPPATRRPACRARRCKPAWPATTSRRTRGGAPTADMVSRSCRMSAAASPVAANVPPSTSTMRDAEQGREERR